VIAAVTGSAAHIREGGRVLFDVGLVTLELTMPPAQARELVTGEPVQLFTYLHFSSQADQLRLFGFTSQLARDLFVMLIGASGIGPAVAVALLDLGVSPLVNAIRGEDERALTKVSGVGPKLAKKIILELGDKLTREFAMVVPEAATRPAEKLGGPFEDALQAVTALGFPRAHAEAALAEARTEYGGDETVELIRRMLAQLRG
jgi:holliday junction DNA helicase RuvA